MLKKEFSKLIIILFITSGCASMRDFFGFPEVKEEVPQVKNEDIIKEEPVTKYSDISNYEPSTDRNYRRVTRKKLEEESELYSSAGSLWQMEGQSSYLFVENKNRKEGDSSAIKLEGSAMRQVVLKVDTIQTLLKDLEQMKIDAEIKKKKDEENALKLSEIEKEKKSILSKKEAETEEAALELAEKRFNERKPASVDTKKTPEKTLAKDEKLDLKELEKIPTRIVERASDGSYKLAGSQIIMIRNKPYKVIATGYVKIDDYNDAMISSDKLIEPQFDVVHMKKTE